MIERPLWKQRVLAEWRRAPIVWLTGVRRVGKTTLCRSFPDARYVNCDLPSAAAALEDPERFFGAVREGVVVLDEVHQLPDPSRTLKIAADAFPKLKVLATGSSTLAATRKFRDALTGRKREVLLLPVLGEEMDAFGVDLERRLFAGGLPHPLLSAERDEGFYSEWLDSYFARDVQELFRVEKRAGFLKLLHILFKQSGGFLDGASLAAQTELSRPTVMNYLEVFQLTHAVHLVRPFHGGHARELVHHPRAYGFDTGFVRFAKGWPDLRTEDMGLLWEHLVLNELLSLPGLGPIQCWRDKGGREVDFVLPRGRGGADAVECKWSASSFDGAGLRAFRERHPDGRNFVVVPGPVLPARGRGAGVQFVNLNGLVQALFG